MRQFNKCKIAFVIATAMAISACSDGKDGKDGEDGAPGEPGPGPTPPVTEVSEVTSVNVISHAIEEGQIRYEFEVMNEEGVLVDGLVKAEAKFAEKTEKGMVLNRDGVIGGYTDTSKEGAVLTAMGEGKYEFVAPMPAVNVASEGIVWLRVGGDDTTEIARSAPVVVAKPDMIHTSTTETCFSCHVDYATSDQRHASYTAVNMDGETDFVAGCLVCHNNVSRAEENGGYATATLQKIGHINHQKFEKDFNPTNCYTCHAEPVVNTSIAGNGCSDCHGDGMSAPIVPADGFDARAFHADKSGLDTLQAMRVGYMAETTDPFKNDLGEWCTTMSLYEVEGETMTQLNIGDLYNPGDENGDQVHIAEQPIVYAGAYLHGYYDESIVGRFGGHTTGEYKVDNDDGTRTHCYPVTNAGFESSSIMASARIGLSYDGWMDSDNEYTISFTAYSDAVDFDTLEPAMAYERRLSVSSDSCTTCHTSETNYHKNGAYNDGGMDCVACHNNGQDRRGAYSAPGYGPMVHSMHWGRGNMLGAKAPEANSADSLNADNCVSCHAEGVSLADIPNQYMLSKAFNEGVSGVMTSPVMANCIACHDSAAAQNHMEQNGGEFNVPAVTGEWYKQDTMESCATCHDTGKSFGIDKYHVFER
ncbi:hypothetical protein [Shewanella maritima]|uniref:multiheme c-type cytochrome n=1 Tax=Shewanella maritima TaxID=2520507 RepID=UPI003734D48B